MGTRVTKVTREKGLSQDGSSMGTGPSALQRTDAIQVSLCAQCCHAGLTKRNAAMQALRSTLMLHICCVWCNNIAMQASQNAMLPCKPYAAH
eukprot:1162033-Pelagomonas_calceolata.AAC.4